MWFLGYDIPKQAYDFIEGAWANSVAAINCDGEITPLGLQRARELALEVLDLQAQGQLTFHHTALTDNQCHFVYLLGA